MSTKDRATRHEVFGHPKPVITCPLCIWIIAGQIIQRKAAR